MSAFNRGLKDAKADAWPKAAAAFQQAVTLDPAFSEAQGNLGSAYSWLGRLDDAAAAYRQAIALDPSTSTHHANLSDVLMRLGRDDDAEREARTAMGLDPTSAQAHFLLGLLLSFRPETRGQAVSHLAFAAREYPEAHLALAGMYGAEGAGRSASAELELYQQALTSKTPRPSLK